MCPHPSSVARALGEETLFSATQQLWWLYHSLVSRCADVSEFVTILPGGLAVHPPHPFPLQDV